MKVSLKKYQKNLAAVVVTFNPDMRRLKILIDATLPQVASIVLVDNQSKNRSLIRALIRGESRIRLVALNKNYGIAYAMNRGVELSLKMLNAFVILLDQDSRPMPHMVEHLRHGFNQDVLVAAVGPGLLDHRLEGVSLRRDSNTKFVDTSFLISSGTMIDLKKILLIGGFRSDYFIDHVDTEWIFRCRRLGYRALISNEAILDHVIGDHVRKLYLGFRLYTVYFHSPLRDYYMFRNTVLLARDSACPWFFKWKLLFRIPKFMAYFLCFGEERGLRLRLMIKGIWHGVCGVSGKLDMKKNKCLAIPKTSLDI